VQDKSSKVYNTDQKWFFCHKLFELNSSCRKSSKKSVFSFNINLDTRHKKVARFLFKMGIHNFWLVVSRERRALSKKSKKTNLSYMLLK